jgi:dolichol-phosphate mannosyltransferase
MNVEKISIIAPMYNEEETAKIYITEMTKVMESLKDFKYEIIVVDDGSTDNTFNELMGERIKYKRIGIVKLSRNYGLEGAINAGLNVATGDAVITMDADLQDPPGLVVELIKMWQAGYEVVNAKRIERIHDSFMKRITANLYYSFVKRMSSDVKLEENVANYRLLSRKVVNTIKNFPEVNPVFRVIVPVAGYKTTTIEYSREKRYAGVTKYSYGKLMKYAIDGITSAGIKPLKYITLIGIIQIIMFLIFTLASIIMLFLGAANWWIMLISAIIIFFMALLFISISIIGEYIGQVFIEIKHRPISIIDKFIHPMD